MVYSYKLFIDQSTYSEHSTDQGIPESSESPQTSRAIARFGMDEFARRLQQKEQANKRKLQETISRAEQLQKENAELRRVISYCMSRS